MPQMKPMNWMILFIFTNMLLLLINMMIYFFKNNKYNLMKIKSNNKKNYSWKW